MNIDELHFETDDFRGRHIVCTRYAWFTHVVRKGHEYMEDQEDCVIETLQHPDHGIRHYDTKDNKRRVYYKLSRSKDYFIKVIVAFDDADCNGTGRIVTAYMPDNIKPGEKPELSL